MEERDLILSEWNLCQAFTYASNFVLDLAWFAFQVDKIGPIKYKYLNISLNLYS